LGETAPHFGFFEDVLHGIELIVLGAREGAFAAGDLQTLLLTVLRRFGGAAQGADVDAVVILKGARGAIPDRLGPPVLVIIVEYDAPDLGQDGGEGLAHRIVDRP
jgi:hypothetical protein